MEKGQDIPYIFCKKVMKKVMNRIAIMSLKMFGVNIFVVVLFLLLIFLHIIITLLIMKKNNERIEVVMKNTKLFTYRIMKIHPNKQWVGFIT